MEQLVLEVMGNCGNEELLLKDGREVSSLCKYSLTSLLAPTPCASCPPWNRNEISSSVSVQHKIKNVADNYPVGMARQLSKFSCLVQFLEGFEALDLLHNIKFPVNIHLPILTNSSSWINWADYKYTNAGVVMFPHTLHYVLDTEWTIQHVITD